jgi:hypothetical protein
LTALLTASGALVNALPAPTWDVLVRPSGLESLVRVLFGEVKPSGRTPVTIPLADQPGTTLYPFGTGLRTTEPYHLAGPRRGQRGPARRPGRSGEPLKRGTDDIGPPLTKFAP